MTAAHEIADAAVGLLDAALRATHQLEALGIECSVTKIASFSTGVPGMSIYRLKLSRLERVTRAIGYVCVVWAWLEDAIDELLAILIPVDRKEISHIMMADSDMRAKIKKLRAVAFVRKLDDAWFVKLETLLDLIDNDLRNKRNRLIHDVWTAPKGLLQRRTRQPKLFRPQAFLRELSTEEVTSVRVPEVWQLVTNIVSTMWKLVGLQMEYLELRKAIRERAEIELGKDVTYVRDLLDEIPSLLSTSAPQSLRRATRSSSQKNGRSK